MLVKDEIIAFESINNTIKKLSKEEKKGAYVALGKYSAYTLPSPEKALYPCPPIHLLATSISRIVIEETRDLSPDVVACISARWEVSPLERLDAIWVKFWVCEIQI